LDLLYYFLSNQDERQLKYFKPHDFDKKTLKELMHNPSFFMMGVFDGKELIGYFFLRCFINKQCFTGRIIAREYQGKGISKPMGKILLESAWNSNFRVFCTVSKNNLNSLAAIRSVAKIRIVKELPNDYLYLEYIKE